MDPGAAQEGEALAAAQRAIDSIQRSREFYVGSGDATNPSRFAMELWMQREPVPGSFVRAVHRAVGSCAMMRFGSYFPILTAPDADKMIEFLWRARCESGLPGRCLTAAGASPTATATGDAIVPGDSVWETSADACVWLHNAVILELVRFWRRTVWRRTKWVLTPSKVREIMSPVSNAYGSAYTPHSTEPNQICMVCHAQPDGWSPWTDGIQNQYMPEFARAYGQRSPCSLEDLYTTRTMRRCYWCDGFVCHLCALQDAWKQKLEPATEGTMSSSADSLPDRKRARAAGHRAQVSSVDTERARARRAQDAQLAQRAHGQRPGLACESCGLYVCYFCRGERRENLHASVNVSPMAGVLIMSTLCVHCNQAREQAQAQAQSHASYQLQARADVPGPGSLEITSRPVAAASGPLHSEYAAAMASRSQRREVEYMEYTQALSRRVAESSLGVRMSKNA